MKYRYRYVFKVFRRFEGDDKKTLAEIREEYTRMSDKGMGEIYLYGGRSDSFKERVDVSVEIWDKPNKRWIPLT